MQMLNMFYQTTAAAALEARYFDEQVLRKRPYPSSELIERALAAPIFSNPQEMDASGSGAGSWILATARPVVFE